jgi:mannose-1-phosphate guanylyltransferase
MKAVIQAGGLGTRLRPYSLILPKPLMPIGGLPVIEMTLKWLRRNGIETVYITIGYLGHLIRAVCGDGSQWGMKIIYNEESNPLGTVGPLLLIKRYIEDGTFITLNGDLLTDINLRDFAAYHRSKGGLLTIASTTKSVNIDLGILESENGRVKSFVEKPKKKYLVSMGIYCMEPEILKYIPEGVPFGFDDLMYLLLDKELPVYVYEHEGYWMDIGRPEDFLKAQEDFKDKQIAILGV